MQLRIEMRMDMRTGMCVDLCEDMCIDMIVGMVYGTAGAEEGCLEESALLASTNVVAASALDIKTCMRRLVSGHVHGACV